jgi:hypothetical protein
MSSSNSASPSIAPPDGWQAIEIAEGVVSYVPSPDTAIVLNSSDFIDGTDHPYITTVSWADLIQRSPAPGQYKWQGTWEGEGYNRVLDENGYLVSEREKGSDIHLTVLFNTKVNNLDHTQPNLTIMVKSDQNLTAQLTNISAFKLDAKTGKVIDRKDFAQLPPVYDVTLTYGNYKVETQVLKQLGEITFVYRVSEGESFFPIRLQADNRLFAERLAAIAQLKEQGWVVKEVPEV